MNRFHGVRAGPRELCLLALYGREPRLLLCESGSPVAHHALVEGAWWGTRPATAPAACPFLATGACPWLRPSMGTVVVHCRVFDKHLEVAGVFGLGLGFGPSDVWGRRRVGINTFHGAGSESVVSQLLPDTVRPVPVPLASSAFMPAV